MKPSKTSIGQKPLLLNKAQELGAYLKTLTSQQVAQHMKVSPSLAMKTYTLIQTWDTKPQHQSVALDTFVGDIYSGLQAKQFSMSDREYANKTLVILSGLYGLIRPLDSIMPYRLEMAYKFPKSPFDNLYTFWGNSIATCLSDDGPIINTSSVEYSKTITPFVDEARIITPQFFSVSPKTGKPTFVTVHSKIARGAFARWLILTRTTDIKELVEFNLLGYQYNQALSQPNQPAFVTNEFGGIGLSIRLGQT